MCRKSERSSKREKLGVSSTDREEKEDNSQSGILTVVFIVSSINPHICQKQLTANPARLVSLSVDQQLLAQCLKLTVRVHIKSSSSTSFDRIVQSVCQLSLYDIQIHGVETYETVCSPPAAIAN